MLTPTTKRARWKPKKTITSPKPDPKSLYKTEMREKYARSIAHELEARDYMDQTEDINTNILKCLDSAAMSVLPKMKKRKNVDEIWKDDEQLNQLINQRNEFQRGSDEYKVVTKAIKRGSTILEMKS